jgi:beta-N-acetylhexosaminidase
MAAGAGQLLWQGLFALDADRVRQAFAPGGIVLFGRNLDPDPATGPARCQALVRGLQARWGGAAPLAVAVDQEGGAVSRLRPWVGATPTLRAVWRQGGPAACMRWGALWGRGLALLGCNVDFAPVADLWDPAGAAAMGDRCAAPDPLDAARAAGAFLAGLERAGVRGCLKHFPGLGGLALDSHLGLPERADPAAIGLHVLPFRMLAHPDRLVMVAHLRVKGGPPLAPLTPPPPSTPTGCPGGARTPRLRPDNSLPASLEYAWVKGNPWGIAARWLPDDLEMGGCAAWPWPERVRRVLAAGHQALLVCQTPEGVDACAQAADQVPEPLRRPAAEAFLDLRRRLPAGPAAFDRGAWDRWVEEVRVEAAACP